MTVECLDHERAFRTRTTGTTVCADVRCLQDPGYFEIGHVRNRIDLRGMVRVPALLRCCDADTLRLSYVDDDGPTVSVVREYRFTVPTVYLEAVLPSRLYRSVWDERTRRHYAEVVHPRCSDDLPREMVGNCKMRVGVDGYAGLLAFCRFSIHTHAGGVGVREICCDRLCCRPEPLTAVELLAIKAVARHEPYYTCSWTEKRMLFKWHVGRESFEPYLEFDRAVGVYNDLHNRMDPRAFKLFAFESWKTPDRDVANADRIYFQSPVNLAGYRWYEPTASDHENAERYRFGSRGGDTECGGRCVDASSLRIAVEVMNLATIPDGLLISSVLVKRESIDRGVAPV